MGNTLYIVFLTFLLFLTLGCNELTNYWAAKIIRIMTKGNTFIVAVDFTNDQPAIMGIIRYDQPENSPSNRIIDLW
ncbi:hypothetical protein [Poriferisphaera corsica]|uniref:hypothetical protein n=1 Tax=Poriferisphaera corsica TaxID=2528020 RepID=UPI00119CBC9C|nr:hypothetical protein [Poriferisphaera corsica]